MATRYWMIYYSVFLVVFVVLALLAASAAIMGRRKTMRYGVSK